MVERREAGDARSKRAGTFFLFFLALETLLITEVSYMKKDSEFQVGDFSSYYPGVGVVMRDIDVAKHVRKHMRLIDRLNVTKVACAALVSQDILFGVISKEELPKNPNWKYCITTKK